MEKKDAAEPKKGSRLDLKDWLEEQGFGDYFDFFVKEGAAKLSDLADLTEDDLKEIVEVWNMGRIKRRQLLKAIDELREPGPPEQEAASEPPPTYSGEGPP